MKFIEQFKKPNFNYRAKPFWAWNGDLKKVELLRQVEIMKEMGFGGFFMHSRTGLVTEYLGEEWFELINACADKAKDLGMEAWLYDEDRWPSGTAGGMVTVEPSLRMHFIEMSFLTDNLVDLTKFLAVFAIKQENEIVTDYIRIQNDADKEKYKKWEFIGFEVVEMQKSSFYNGYTFADTLNIDATKCFLELTHEQYVKKCGDRIGDSILGVFTDEPHRGSLMSSFEQGVNSSAFIVPFTQKLPLLFKEKFGYDIVAKLPELLLKITSDGISPVKWQYVELLQEMFLDNYAKPIDKWCRANHMILTGHILHENNLTSQTAMSGSVMRYYEYMEYPGIDFLGSNERCYWIAKQLQSVARQLGKKMLLSELYGATGWQMSLEKYKAVGDWQALYDINLRCPHLSWYTMEGQAKRDYPASILHQSTWWKEYAYLEEYYARIAVFKELGTPCCDVLVINPIESVWAQVSTGWCNGLSPKAKRIVELEEIYQNTFYSLQQAHIDFDYGDEEMMSRYCRVENGTLFVGNAGYKVVVISGMDTIRSSTVKLLQEFTEQGGKVIICGDKPKYMDCIASDMQINSIKMASTQKQLTQELSDYAVKITYKNNASSKKILCQMKQENQTKHLMLINDDRENEVKNVTVRVKSNGTVTRFVPETGEMFAVPCERVGEYLVITISFERSEVYLLTFGESFATNEKSQELSLTNEITIDKELSYKLDEKNICVLDFAKVSIDKGAYSKPMEILKADQHIREHFNLPYRGGQMLQPWFVRKREIESKGNVSLLFDFTIETLPQSEMLLVLEEVDNFAVSINGHKLEYQPNDFYWADICYKSISIPLEYLKIGDNQIQLQTVYKETMNLEAVFLFGDFGVKLEGNKKIITTLPKVLSIGDITNQGLPFYSGKLTYLCDVSSVKAEHMGLKVQEFAGSCVKVEGNGKEIILAWKPFEADVTDLIENGVLKVTVVLTRRNTFGPLHQVPANSPVCGPDSFLTSGKSFTTNYSLLKAGMTKPIVILY